MDVHIIEDDKSLQILYAQIADISGFNTECFSSSEEYLDYFKSPNATSPLTILTDVNLPGKSGYQLINEIRKSKPEQKFIVLTGSPWDTINESGLACFYLRKPVTLHRLQSVFKAQLKCLKCGIQPESNKCYFLNDLDDFSIDDWCCPHLTTESK